MKRQLFLPNLLLAAIASVACAADSDTGSIQIKVKDIHGKAAAGTKLWLERMDVKEAAKQVVTDGNGESTFRNLAPGTYKVSAYDTRTPAAAATVVKAPASGQQVVKLSLEKMVRGADIHKKKKRYVYVAGETGTHIGGGRWVEVENDASGTGANPVDKKSGQMLTQPQSFQIRPYQPPGN